MHLLATAGDGGLAGQATQILGALMVLAGFAAAQFGVLRHDSPAYSTSSARRSSPARS